MSNGRNKRILNTSILSSKGSPPSIVIKKGAAIKNTGTNINEIPDVLMARLEIKLHTPEVTPVLIIALTRE